MILHNDIEIWVEKLRLNYEKKLRLILDWLYKIIIA